MLGGSEFDSTWYVWTSRIFSRTRAVFSRVWNVPWPAHILMKTAWNLKLGIFSTQKGLKWAHQEHFKHTAQARRSFRNVHSDLIGPNMRFNGTAQTTGACKRNPGFFSVHGLIFVSTCSSWRGLSEKLSFQFGGPALFKVRTRTLKF